MAALLVLVVVAAAAQVPACAFALHALASPGPNRTGETPLKVAALASKLEHWLTCNRLATIAAATSQAANVELASSTTSGGGAIPSGSRRDPPEVVAATAAAAAAAEAELAGESVASKLANKALADPSASLVAVPLDRKLGGSAREPPPTRVGGVSGAMEASATSHCKAHFDGHVCWPATRAGASAKVQCPRLNWVSSASRELVVGGGDDASATKRIAMDEKGDKGALELALMNSSSSSSLAAGAAAQPMVAPLAAPEQRQQHEQRSRGQTNDATAQVNNVATLVTEGKGKWSREVLNLREEGLRNVRANERASRGERVEWDDVSSV